MAFSTIVGKPKAIKKKPRSASEQERVYGTKEYRAWFHLLPCCVCGIEGYTQQAHVGNGGLSRKARAERSIPMCGPHPNWQQRTMGYATPIEKGCHRAQHDQGAKSFASMRGLDYEREIINVAEAWQRHLSTRGGG